MSELVVVVLLGLVIVGRATIEVLFARHASPSSRERSRYDTAAKAIRREKDRYANEEISLDKFESRAYQMIPVDDPVTEPAEVSDAE